MNEIRIPTVQFGYINVQFEGTPEEAIEQHNHLVALYQTTLKSQEMNSNGGLDTKTWNHVLDTYLRENSIQMEHLDGMNERQKLLINELRKSLSRIQSRESVLRENDPWRNKETEIE